MSSHFFRRYWGMAVVLLTAAQIGAAENNIPLGKIENPVRTLKVIIWRPTAEDTSSFDETKPISADQVEPYPNVQTFLFRDGEQIAQMTTNQDGVGYAQNIAEGEGEIIAENSKDNRFGTGTIQIQYPESRQSEYHYLLTDNGLSEWNPENLSTEEIPQELAFPDETLSYQNTGYRPSMRGGHGGLLGLAGLAGLAGIGTGTQPVSPFLP